MKLWILSDLHHDVVPIPELTYPEADVVILAGDIQNDRFVRELEGRYENVIYVSGNHEYYGHSIPERQQKLRDKLPNSFLENDTKIINGVKFLGATLWTDYDLYGSRGLCMRHASTGLNDHRKITWQKEPWMRFRPQEARILNTESKQFLVDEFRDHDLPVVVVTHHAPSPWSIHERYSGDILNAAYASDLHSMMYQYQPKLWIHGHVHNSFDYQVERTRVLCNPRGYGDENPHWNPELVIEI